MLVFKAMFKAPVDQIWISLDLSWKLQKIHSQRQIIFKCHTENFDLDELFYDPKHVNNFYI